jgi:serralysin
MTDIADKLTTLATISVGSTVTSLIDFSGDHDWFLINLRAGQTVTIKLNGSGATPLSDPYLGVRDAAGTLVAQNDDDGPGRNAALTFYPSASGNY